MEMAFEGVAVGIFMSKILMSKPKLATCVDSINVDTLVINVDIFSLYVDINRLEGYYCQHT